MRIRGHRPLIRLILVVSVMYLAPAQGAPVTFNTALPVGEGILILRGQFLYRQAGDDPAPGARDLKVLGAISVLGYGVTGNLALFALVPYLERTLVLDTANGSINRTADGIGDVQFFARYTVFQEDAPGSTLRVAPFAGLKTPTGDDDVSDRFGRLPRPLQPGSGSLDPFGGVVVTYQTLDYQIDSQLRYQARRAADNFAFGNELHFDTSLQYRLWPRELGAGVPGFLYGVIETNLRHRDRNREDGRKDPDSGGTQLSLSPGLQYVTRRWILEAVVQLPVARDLNGGALGEDFTVRAGFRLNF